MIIKIMNQNDRKLTVQERKKFIPFINQRNHMGEIIQSKPKGKTSAYSMQIFQNLKKSSKEYFFEKKFQKMKQKLQRCKINLSPKEHDYDQEVQKCLIKLERAEKNKTHKLKHSSLQPIQEKQNLFFVDINKKVCYNLNNLKEEFDFNRKYRMQRAMNQFKSTNTSFYKEKHTKSNRNSEQDSFVLHGHHTHHKQNSMGKLPKTFGQASRTKINRQLFKNLSPNGQKMTDFTNCGLKYRHLVQEKNKNPWKKWYLQSTLQIFPGEVVKIKQLQKSIY